MIDLDAYFQRIGFTGPAAVDRDTLAALHRLHPQAIPFENLDPLLGVPVQLDSASLEAKLVRSGRGGYCYEHNLLFMHVLQALGFAVRGLSARVLLGAAGTRARAHMLLAIDLGGERHIADVGFGGATPTTPLRLDFDGEQASPHEPYRIVCAQGDFVLQSKIGEAWKSIYQFDLQEQLLADYDVANWYKSTSPNSYFTKNLMAARAVEGRRFALRNAEFSVHHRDGITERRTLRTPLELREMLTGAFALKLPASGALDAALARLTAAAA
ncbi:MAG TPA: arylamine N-acetyltransferase [Xanthobacteraceae bacterium]|nr:arylamine N-acetyltransferase [Xanthobacteraceae bacterium]